MKKSKISSLISLMFISPILSASVVMADESIDLTEVTVKANRFEHKASETTYASEIHTAKQIEASAAATLYDYLAQQTSLNILSNFGNKSTPSINMRGFGGENGHQNLVITVDGQRINNIDMQSQLLGAIPLGNIERIEIAKGSGSVIYGDGATAGAIQIYTKNKTGVTVSSSLGNFGQKNSYLNAGIAGKYVDLSASLAHDSYDGFSKKDETGHKDQFTSNTQNVKLKVKLIDELRLIAEATSARNDVRYVNSMTLAEFNDNPRQVTQKLFSQTYTHQAFDTDQWRIGAEYDITSQLKLSAIKFREDKRSEFVNFASESFYDYESNELTLHFVGDVMSVIGGLQAFDGDRKNASNVTTKNNEALFLQAEYHPEWLSEDLTLSLGARSEKVDYRYAPNTGNILNDSEHLHAWDIGANYRFSPTRTGFVNLNKAYQAPDIDRFFLFGGGFNGFIKPAETKTLNIGLNQQVAKHQLKATTFYTHLQDEIYLVPGLFKNTNLDRSHKYGFELQDIYQWNDQLSASLIYNYTRAKIDREDDGAGAYNGKDLPGVPKHTFVANVNYEFFQHAIVNVNQTWRSQAYAYNDFENNFSQKQAQYASTNIALRYQYKNVQLFTSINNIFAHENAIQVEDNALYPVDFVRTWRVGFKADF